METTKENSQSPLDYLAVSIGQKRPHGGGLGMVVAGAGMGKTALLIQIGLGELMAGRRVFHAAVGHPVDYVRNTYDRLLEEHQPAGTTTAPMAALKHELEKRRHIQSYMGQSFSVEKVERVLSFLSDEAGFEPDVMLVDGLSITAGSKEPEQLKQLASRRGFAAWLSVVVDSKRSQGQGAHPPLSEALEPFRHLMDLGLELVPEDHGARVGMLTPGGAGLEPSDIGIHVDPFGLLIPRR